MRKVLGLLTVSILALLPGLAAAADAAPERYVQDRWRTTRDTAALGGVIAGLGVVAAGTGVAFRDDESVPSNVLVGTGTLAAGTGAGIMAVVGLQQRYEFLNKENSPIGGYMALGLVGLSGIGLVSAAAADPDNPAQETLLYGSAGLAGTALIPAALQLSSNGSRFHSRSQVSWVPVVSKNHIGGVASVRF